MKKLLAVLLAALLVVPAVFMFSASADSTLVSAGKSYTISGTGTGYVNLEGKWPSKYDANLTDGVAASEITYATTGNWFSFYYNVKEPTNVHTNAPDGVGTVTIDLGEVTKGIDTFKINVATPGKDGIGIPRSIEVEVSDDNNTFTKVAEFSGFEVLTTGYWLTCAPETAVSARYVRFVVTTEDSENTHTFLNELEVYADPSAAVEPEPEVQKTYENTYKVDENEEGYKTASVEVPYGYTWNINYINGSIVGEDATICTTQDAFNASNPNWAITL